ncbi:unnamed protein product [Alopecurus aequalis]
MHRMAGLPLDGEHYEEFVPPLCELENSLLLYPKFLSRLLDIWHELAINNQVGFKDWCDFFHNRDDGCFVMDTLESERIYAAAFIALWLCRFVVVGGGPYVRPGVLVMASWIVLGRRISLGPPALCSLYYSLRVISTHPVGPSFTQRIWPVHFIAGWMGRYLKTPFGNRVKTPRFPSPRILIVKPHMVNTMFRTPKSFTPEKAHDFLENRHNISCHPYSLTTPDGLFQQKKVFLISIRRGMLPWWRGCLNHDALIVEPYHPDRVAQQFRFDQVVPFSPLESLYTTSEIGIAYAFWLHLLSLDPAFQYFPSDTRMTDSSLAWASWWKTFVKPFARISNSLRHGSMSGTISYDERKKSRYALQSHIKARPLFQRDLKVVRRVHVERQAQHIAVIERTERRIKDRWMPVLHEYLSDLTAAPPIQPNKVSSLLWDDDGAGISSAYPLAIDNEPSEIVPTSGKKRCRQSSLTHVGEEDRLPSKRKLDFSAEFAPSELFHEILDLDIDDFPNGEEFNPDLAVEANRVYNDLFETCLEGNQLDGLGTSHTFMGVENVPPTLMHLIFHQLYMVVDTHIFY